MILGKCCVCVCCGGGGWSCSGWNGFWRRQVETRAGSDGGQSQWCRQWQWLVADIHIVVGARAGSKGQDQL